MATGYKFSLEFINDGTGKVQIDEPIGFASLIWVLKQKDKLHGRDVSFNDGESEIKFVWTRNHYLAKIFFYNQIYGFESKVRFYVEIDGVQTILGDLDFAMAKTDGLEYFSCKVIQDSNLQIINRRKEVKVDMFSNKDLDGEVMDALIPTNILVKAKAVFQESKWEQVGNFNIELMQKSSDGFSLDALSKFFFVNSCNSIISSEIEDTLSSFELSTNQRKSYPTESEFSVIKAASNLKNIEIKIPDLDFNFEVKRSIVNGYSEMKFVVKYGLTFDTATTLTLLTQIKHDGENYTFKGDLSASIKELKRGESIWIQFEFKNRMSSSIILVGSKLWVDLEVKNFKTIITAESRGYNSITKAFRLYDVMKQLVKSSSGQGIKSTYFHPNGEFYDLFIVNGNLLRSITDKPFTISLDEISKSMTMMNADYEVNEEVFFGIEKEFYKSEEIWFFDKVQFSGMKIAYNPEHTINKYNYKFKNYQALKENEQPNSGDTIHGETEMLLGNKMVENTKAVEVAWIMDSFLIDEARKKSIEISKGTSYQNDTDIFSLDCIKNEVDLSYTEASEFNHEWEESLQRLILRSNETLNFNIIGIFEGSSFEIKAPDKNTGFYTVYKVSSQELQLTWISGGVMSINSDGVRFTSYTYSIPKEQLPYITRTNEDIITDEIKSPETFANLRYSVKRNIANYYNEYLATCNLYHKDKAIATTSYYHNGKAIISHNGLTTTENQEITPTNPILSPLMYNDMVFSNFYFDEFLEFQKKIRSKRGYFRTIGNDKNPIKAYVKDLKYDPLKKELTITAKGKYQPIFLTIVTQDRLTTINNETTLRFLKWEIVDDKLLIYDLNRERLYPAVHYNRVSINNATTESLNIFKDWMALIP
jgi:hypothetical protein